MKQPLDLTEFSKSTVYHRNTIRPLFDYNCKVKNHFCNVLKKSVFLFLNQNVPNIENDNYTALIIFEHAQLRAAMKCVSRWPWMYTVQFI